jgi:hypothetical protein
VSLVCREKHRQCYLTCTTGETAGETYGNIPSHYEVNYICVTNVMYTICSSCAVHSVRGKGRVPDPIQPFSAKQWQNSGGCVIVSLTVAV